MQHCTLCPRNAQRSTSQLVSILINPSLLGSAGLLASSFLFRLSFPFLFSFSSFQSFLCFSFLFSFSSFLSFLFSFPFFFRLGQKLGKPNGSSWPSFTFFQLSFAFPSFFSILNLLKTFSLLVFSVSILLFLFLADVLQTLYLSQSSHDDLRLNFNVNAFSALRVISQDKQSPQDNSKRPTHHRENINSISAIEYTWQAISYHKHPTRSDCTCSP